MAFLTSLYNEAVANLQYYGSIDRNILFHTPTLCHVVYPVLFILAAAGVLILCHTNRLRMTRWLLGLWVLSVILQTGAAARHLYAIEAAFHNTDRLTAKELIWGSDLELVRCAQARVGEGRHSGALITALDERSLLPGIFSYELYPAVDLVTPASHPQVLICLHSPECSRQAPVGFHIMCRRDPGYVALRGKIPGP